MLGGKYQIHRKILLLHVKFSFYSNWLFPGSTSSLCILINYVCIIVIFHCYCQANYTINQEIFGVKITILSVAQTSKINKTNYLWMNFLDHCYEYATWWALRLSDQGKLQKQIGKCKLHKKVAEEENTVHTTMMMPSVLLLASTLANMAPHTLDCLDTVSALFTWSWVFNRLSNRTVLKSLGVFNFVHKKFPLSANFVVYCNSKN